MIVASILASVFVLGAGPQTDLGGEVPPVVVELRNPRWIRSYAENLERYLNWFVAGYDCSDEEAQCARAEVLQAWAEQVVYEDAAYARMNELMEQIEQAGETDKEDSPLNRRFAQEFRETFLAMPCDPEVLRQRMEMCSGKESFAIPRIRWAELYAVWDLGMDVAEDDVLRMRRLPRRMKRYRNRIPGLDAERRPMPAWRYLKQRKETEAAELAAEDRLLAARAAGELPSQESPVRGVYTRPDSVRDALGPAFRGAGDAGVSGEGRGDGDQNAPAGEAAGSSSDAAPALDAGGNPTAADTLIEEVRAEFRRRLAKLGRAAAERLGSGASALTDIAALTDAFDARIWAYLQEHASAYETADALSSLRAYRAARAELDAPLRALRVEFDARLAASGEATTGER